MRFSERRARVNRAFTNHLVRPISGFVPAFSIIENVGRRSGRIYRTPVSMFRTPDGVAVLLFYGPDRDWVRNLQAAGRGWVELGRQTFEVRDPRIVPTEEALPELKTPWRQLLGPLNVEQTLLLTRTD